MTAFADTPLPFDPATADLDVLLKRLNLANARRNWRTYVEQAEESDWSCRDFLVRMVVEEIAHRQRTRLQRGTRHARFPFLKTIDDYDFTLQSTLRPALLGSYLGPELVSEGRSLILMGKTGRGKTHLAVAIAYRAIQNGFTALFTTAAELIEDLSTAGQQGRLRDALSIYLQPHVLVIDEVGYLSYGNDAANVLFHVVNERHQRRRPMIFTTNKSPSSQWGDVLHDADLADAIVDRVLERGRLLILDGPSYRTKHIDSAPGEPARISGIHRPDFPEPTRPRPAANRDDAKEDPPHEQRAESERTIGTRHDRRPLVAGGSRNIGQHLHAVYTRSDRRIAEAADYEGAEYSRTPKCFLGFRDSGGREMTEVDTNPHPIHTQRSWVSQVNVPSDP